MMRPLDDREAALVALGRALHASGYRFTTVTPATHRRVNARPANAEAEDLHGIFGWSRPFRRAILPSKLADLLAAAGALVEVGNDRWRADVRFSSLGAQLYAHSSFPTDAADAVFFGPDTYRFVAAVARRARPARLAVDLGCGSGAGGLMLAGRVERMILSDVNARALELSRVNAELAGAAVELAHGDLFAALAHVGEVDLVIANPPYLVDAAARTYRDGGGRHGLELPLRIVAEGLQRLSSGGQLILYSGAPFCRGVDLLRSRLLPLIDGRDLEIDYETLDPDVFGEELDEPAYRDIERIAVVCLDVRRPR